MKHSIFFFLISNAIVISGCKDESIQTYRVAKELSPLLESVPAAQPAQAPSREINWKVPNGWREQAPSSMRVGSFLVPGSNGQTADVSVVPLSGSAGGDLANFNRWREQIELSPLSEADLSAMSEAHTFKNGTVRVVDFVSDKLLIENRFKKRIVAAIYPQGQRTWFFKMAGEDSTVRSAKSAFMEFVKSAHF